MKKILITTILGLGLIPIIYAADGEIENGKIEWKFCNDHKYLEYSVFNGTLHDTAHLRLHDAASCTDTIDTDLQLQIFHTSNNYTDFSLKMPKSLQNEIIDVRVVGKGYLENFQFNDTHNELIFSDFKHDKNGLVTIILDLK